MINIIRCAMKNFFSIFTILFVTLIWGQGIAHAGPPSGGGPGGGAAPMTEMNDYANKNSELRCDFILKFNSL